MADQDISRKILIDIQSRADKASSEVVDLNKQLDDLLVKQLKMKDANQQNTQSYVQLASQIRNTKQAIRDKNKELDNSFKAMNAESNSIARNRALVAAMTAEYIKLGQELGKTDPKVEQLGKSISDLTTKLKAQEAAIGQHQRNVGNYEEAFNNALRAFGQFVPGLQTVGSVLTTAVKGFGFLPNAISKTGDVSAKLNQTMGFMPQKINTATKSIETFGTQSEKATIATEGLTEAAPAAGEGLEAAAVGVGALAAAVVALIAAVVAVITHFAELTPNADALAQRFAYLKGAIRALTEDWQTFLEVISGDGSGFSKLWSDMKTTGQEAANLKMALQDLSRAQQQDIVDDAKADAQIAELQLKMRNRRNTVEQERQYFNEIQKIAQDKHDGNKKLADQEYELAVRTATNSKRFTKEEIDNLRRLGVEYAIILDKRKGLVNGEEDIQKIVAAQQKQIATDRELQMIEERKQNRLDAVEMRAEQAAEKEKQLMLELQQGYNEQVNQRTESYQRMLELQQDAFGRELSQTAEHYHQLLFKEQEFILKQEKIRDDKKSTPKVRAAATRNIGAARSTMAQIESEQYIATEKLLVDHNREVLDLTRKAALDLKNLQIQNITDVHDREVAAANNAYAEKQAELDKENALLQQQRRNITKQLADNDAKAKNDKTRYTADQIQALKTDLNATDQLLANASDKRIAIEKATTRQLDKIDRDFYNSQQLMWDQIYILQTGNKKGISGGKNNPFNKDLQNAKENDLRDQEAKELSAEGLTAVQKTLIHEQYLERIKELDDQYRDQRVAAEIQSAELVANTGFSIISNAIKHTADQRQADLERAKTTELNNQALTKTQVAIINEKYRKQEGAAKVKEFRDTQKIDIAKTVMAGARAVVEDLTSPWKIPFDIATTAAEIAVIATQQPPAYAKGTGPVHVGSGKVRGPGTGTSDSIPARLSNGESVINAKSTSMFAGLLSAINVAGGGVPFATPSFTGRFATGGVASTTYVPTITNNFTPALPTITHLSDQSIGDIVNGMGAVQIVTDVKDINNQQAIRAKVMDRTVL